MLLEWAKIKIDFDKQLYPQFNPVWIYCSGLFGSLAFATDLFWVKSARVKKSTAKVKNKVCKSYFNSANFDPRGKFQLLLIYLSNSRSNEPNRSQNFLKDQEHAE